MSETPRVYSASGARFQLARRARRRRVLRTVLLIILAGLLYFFWISRDTHPVAMFVPADQSLQVVAPRIMLARHRIADSHVWKGIPENWLPVNLPNVLNDRHNMPEWVRSNLAGGGVILTANDTAGWSDFLLISRMTRVGCALERVLRFSPASVFDWAGGLRLRFWEPANLFYAVRGRTLVMSPSRDAIIASLTLDDTDRVAIEAVSDALDQTGAEDIQGMWRPTEDSAPGRVLQEVRFASRVEANEAYLKLRATFRPEVTGDLKPYWAGAAPAKLAGPIEGPIAISANFGTDVETTWAALGELVDLPWLTQRQWQSWRNEDDGRSAAAVLTNVLGAMGPGMRVTWFGVDLNEMAPTPLLGGSIDGDREEAISVLEQVASPNRRKRLQAQVMYDDEAGVINAPLMSGPSMTPIAQWKQDRLMFCTSSAMADRFLTEDTGRIIPLSRPGNLYLRARPSECTQLVVQAGRELIHGGLIQGYSPEEYDRVSAQWLETAGALEFIEALALINHEGLEADIRLTCTAGPAKS